MFQLSGFYCRGAGEVVKNVPWAPCRGYVVYNQRAKSAELGHTVT